jgi:hypothetical protein
MSSHRVRHWLLSRIASILHGLALLGPFILLLVLWQMNPGRGAGGMFRTATKPQTRFSDVVV